MNYYIPALEMENTLKMAKELDELVVDEKFTFYIEKMSKVRPFGMLVATAAIKNIRQRYSDMAFSFSKNSQYKNVIDYAGHMGFFKAISEDINLGKNPGEALGNSNYIPITKLDINDLHQREIEKGNFIAIGDSIEKESARLAKIITRDNVEFQKVMTYLIREIIRNIPEHSESDEAWICGQYWESYEKAEIAIMDKGIGIRKSLQKNIKHRQYINNDEDAVNWAMKAGISQAFQPTTKNRNRDDDVWANSGFGLYVVSQICKKLDGSFCLASGNKYISINKSKTETGNTYFEGTAVRISISTQKISDADKLIKDMVAEGEKEAKMIRNAFKTASIPSKGLLDSLK